MTRWRDQLLALASHDAAGLLPAAVLLLAGAVAWRAGGAVPAALGGLGLLGGTVLALAALRQVQVRARVRRHHPPPGRRVDVGGYRVHVLAEGEVRAGRAPVVWFAGGHAGGYTMNHLHQAFRGETRSILVDRPGTGWSDVGPFPRTTAREADEVVRALEAAGEPGPFVWVGHSFGGLLVANVARRRPDLVHALVLLDPTPLETLVFGPRLSALAQMRRVAWQGGFALWFGIDLYRREQARLRRTPAYASVLDAMRRLLGPEGEVLREVEAHAGNRFAQASIFRELTPEGVAACAWDTVVYDRDLGDLPVWLVAPRDEQDGEIAALPEAQADGGAQARRMARFYAATRERYLATSTRSRRVVAPPGSGHNFVYEQAEFTIGVMREVICGAGADGPPR